MGYSKEHYLANKEIYATKNLAWRLKNKERCKINRKRHYEENKEHSLTYSKEYNLKRKFQLTMDEYNQMLIDQNNVCAICEKLCTRALAVDHCHKTKRVRGLLCNNCNRGIGHLKEDKELLLKAIQYLEFYGS